MASRRFMLGAIGLTAALAACTSSSSPHHPAKSTTSPAVTSTSAATSSHPAPPPTSAAPASAARLAAIVLQPADLPVGWVGTAYIPSASAAATTAAFSTCLGVRDVSLDKVADSHSQKYALGTASVSSSASSYPTAASTQIDRAALANPKYSSCFETGLRALLAKSVPAGGTIGAVSVVVSQGAGTTGSSNVYGTLATSFSVVNAGVTLTILSTSVLISGPLLEAELDFTSPGQQIPADVQAKLVRAVATRAALG